MTRPNITEAAEYYFRYIDRVPSDDIMATLENQMGEMFELLSGISEEQSLHSYAPGKWTIREVLNHMNDGERLFAGRALWFARGFTDPLPGFDQETVDAVIAAARQQQAADEEAAALQAEAAAEAEAEAAESPDEAAPAVETADAESAPEGEAPESEEEVQG